jgi:hypothetical protein
MTTWFAQNSSVNIDSVNQWNDDPAGAGTWLTWASLGSADVLVANGKTLITINVSFTCTTITTAATGGTAGGGFICSTSGITITSDVAAGTGVGLEFNHTSGTSYMTGNITTSNSSYAYGIYNSSTGGQPSRNRYGYR